MKYFAYWLYWYIFVDILQCLQKFAVLPGDFAGFSCFSLFRTCVSVVLCPAEITVTFSWTHRAPPTLFLFPPHFSDVWTVNGRFWWLCLWLNPRVGSFPGVERVAAGRTQYLPPVLQDGWCPGTHSSSRSLVWCSANCFAVLGMEQNVLRAWQSSSFITVAVTEQLSPWWEVCSWVWSYGHLKSIWWYWYNTQAHFFFEFGNTKGQVWVTSIMKWAKY